MFKDNILKKLLIINLFFLSIILFSKMFFVHRIIRILFKSFLIPFIFSVFLFYIIKPINTIFMKNGLKPSVSALLTLILGLFIATGCITFFSNYIATQFDGTIEELISIVKNQTSYNQLMNNIYKYIPAREVNKAFANIANIYTKDLVYNLMFVIKYVLHTFSTLLLMLIIVFYLLKDGSKFKDRIMCIIPENIKKSYQKVYLIAMRSWVLMLQVNRKWLSLYPL